MLALLIRIVFKRLLDERNQLVSSLFDEFSQLAMCPLIDHVEAMGDGDLQRSELHVRALQPFVRDA